MHDLWALSACLLSTCPPAAQAKLGVTHWLGALLPPPTRPLHMAAGKGQTGVVQELLAAGARTESRNRQGATPLMWAAANGALPVIAALLAKGAQPGMADNEGDTALHYAANKNQVRWACCSCMHACIRAG